MKKFQTKKNNYREQHLPCLQSEYLHAIAISSQPLVSIRSNWLFVLVSIAEEEVLKCIKMTTISNLILCDTDF